MNLLISARINTVKRIKKKKKKEAVNRISTQHLFVEGGRKRMGGSRMFDQWDDQANYQRNQHVNGMAPFL